MSCSATGAYVKRRRRRQIHHEVRALEENWPRPWCRLSLQQQRAFAPSDWKVIEKNGHRHDCQMHKAWGIRHEHQSQTMWNSYTHTHTHTRDSPSGWIWIREQKKHTRNRNEHNSVNKINNNDNIAKKSSFVGNLCFWCCVCSPKSESDLNEVRESNIW